MLIPVYPYALIPETLEADEDWRAYPIPYICIPLYPYALIPATPDEDLHANQLYSINSFYYRGAPYYAFAPLLTGVLTYPTL